jgi:hypothetical protein
MAQQTDYTGLITSEHADKPKFVAMVGAVSQAFVDIQNQLATVAPSYDPDVAIGVQLDAVGLWVGVTRDVTTPLTGVYFSLDVTGLGFDQGVWQGPFDPSSGVTSLDDETFRLLIRARIAANHWDGTLEGSAAILDLIFQGDGTYVFIQDNQDMTITFGISGTIPSALFLALLQNGYIPIKPEGVAVSYVVTSVSEAALFGFDVENQYVSGLDVGAWGVSNLVPQNYLDYSFALDVSTLG